MNKCLQTKLKAVVNNPNLPILERMQQFTIDAITASGNAEMTDAQKWALNHLFYALGKFDDSENSVWNKIDFVFLPIISKAVDHSCIDYTNNVNYGYSPYYDDIQLINGGLSAIRNDEYSLFIKNITKTKISPINISMFSSYAAVNNNTTCVRVRYQPNSENKYEVRANPYSQGSTQNFGIFLTGQAGNFAYIEGVNPSVIRNINVASASAAGVSGCVVLDDNVVVGQGQFIADRYTPIDHQDRYVIPISNPSINAPLQMVIIGECVEFTEAQKIVAAMNNLRNEFMTI